MLQTTIMRFSELLEIRLKNGVFITEDAVRYTFFAALMDTTNLQPHHVIPEQPHPVILGAEIDTFVHTGADSCDIVMEFKYDRGIPSGNQTPSTQKSGKLFCDVQRLALIPSQVSTERIMVYLTNQTMRGYLLKHFSSLWNLQVSHALEVSAVFFINRPKTFMRELIGGEPFGCSITLLHSAHLPDSHELRVYKINSINICEEISK